MSALPKISPTRPNPTGPNPVCHAAPARGPEPLNVRAIRAALSVPGATRRQADLAAEVVGLLEGLPLAAGAVHLVRPLLGGMRVALHHPAWRGALSPTEARVVAAVLQQQPYGPTAFVLGQSLADAAALAEMRGEHGGRLNGPTPLRRLFDDPHVTGLGSAMGFALLAAVVTALMFWRG